jgi:DNA replication protein DnaC
MNTLENVCVLADKCKKAGTEVCNITCYPYVLTHGIEGDGGFWKATNVPTKYRDRFLKNLNLIEKQNPQAYSIAKMFIQNILEYVSEGIGLFLYSIPNPENKQGTGTGKTTVATTIINEYTIARIIEHVTGKRKIEVQPALFVRVSEFQNVYNAQFRGSEDMREQASKKYYQLKALMIKTELLCLDDIALRTSTEGLTNELYEILDERSIEGRSTIFTSNLPLEKVGELLSEQIASRIAGMTELVGFVGKDNRKVFE